MSSKDRNKTKIKILNIFNGCLLSVLITVIMCLTFTSVLFIYLFGVLHRFEHYIGHIKMGSFMGRGNQIQLVEVLYCRPLESNYQLSHI